MPRPIPDIDLHGKTVAEAERIFEEWLNRSRVDGHLIEMQFIVGTGKIMDRLKGLAKEYGLNAYVPLGNRGCLVVEFE